MHHLIVIAPARPSQNNAHRHPLLPASTGFGAGIASSTAGAAPGRIRPNDVLLGGARPGALLLTGANTSGKSTLLRAVGAATVCAQVGCYAPARAARLAPADALLVRAGAGDRILQGQSTFAVEMAEAALALALATPASLIVQDELGRCAVLSLSLVPLSGVSLTSGL